MPITLKSGRMIDWAKPNGCPDGFTTHKVYAGRSDTSMGAALELAHAIWGKGDRPTRESMGRLHTLRLDRRATPLVLLVETTDGKAFVFGPNPTSAPVGPLAIDEAQRLLQVVLDEPSAMQARERLAALAHAMESTAIPGVKNSGLFANHELRVGVPQRQDWADACRASSPLLNERGPALISRLGFRTSNVGAHALVLTGDGPRPSAIAVMLQEREAFDTDSQRFAVSPVAYGLRMAEQQGVPWLILLRGTQVRLYPARIDLGVGRKGLAETFLEIDLPHLKTSESGYLSLIFSAAALADGGSTHQIMAASAQYAVALGARLRDKVYEEIIPELSLAVAVELIEQGREMDAEGLDLAYQLTLRIFFRMLFQVYAEDRKLLPYGENAKYDRNALKTVARDLVENPDQEFDPESTSLWDDLAQVWRVIDSGDKAWGVPPYNGGLFTSDPEYNEHGALISTIRITNDVMGPALRALLIDEDEDGTVGPIDFRSLSVREFGTIYEGLLESSLGLAEVDLTLDEKGTWLPAKRGDDVYALAGQVYFHNTSGQRKGTGSYFTPSFVVEHLLERSLDPALDEHLHKIADLLAKGDQAGAADLFFDFRVADLAMGSGHFLTAAIDHIEQKMAAFLSGDGHAIPGVTKELALMGDAARKALGPDAPEPEPSSLLRRQIARRCIYGLDINPIAVELARVSIWIHTFVRGLPMSSLDHNLVCANSLTGIGSIDEALDVLVPGRNGQRTLFDQPIEDALTASRQVLLDVSRMPELDRNESREASKAVRRALDEARTARLLFDAAVLTRIGRADLVSAIEPAKIAVLAARPAAQLEIAPLSPAHMPALFPEVFLRDNGGFDVLLGNPPWEALHVREDRWWGVRIPGLHGLTQAKRDLAIANMKRRRPDLVSRFASDQHANDKQRSAILAGAYQGLGAGHVDLYQAFAWRNLHAIRSRGRFGIVLPRIALSGSGLKIWRQEALRRGSFTHITHLVNSNHWVFEDVHPQYTIALTTYRLADPGELNVCGPFHNEAEFRDGRGSLAKLQIGPLRKMSDTLSVPMVKDATSGEILGRMQLSPRFDLRSDTWDFRPSRGDLVDKSLFSFDGSDAASLPILSGASFSLWNPEYGPPFAYAKSISYRRAFFDKVQRSRRSARSAYAGLEDLSISALPIDRARIALRWITRPTDTRTCIACLLPPGVGTTDAATVLSRNSGGEREEAFLLGVISSHIFDWYVRRWVELNLTFEILSPAPIPRPDFLDWRCIRVIEIAGRLAARDERYVSWATAVGVPVGSISSGSEQVEITAELEALVAALYGLHRPQVQHLFSTFHRGWDHRLYSGRVLELFDSIESRRD